MSQEYCLPIAIKLDTSSRLTILMVVLYLLPLVLVFIEFELVFALGIAIACLVALYFERHTRSATGDYSELRINKNGEWQLLSREGKIQRIGLKNSMGIGAVLFLQYTLDGRSKRALILEREQKEPHFHRLKVYLRNIGVH